MSDAGDSGAAASKDDSHTTADHAKGSLLNTVAISLAISILSIVIAAFNLYWTTLRPASIHATLTIVIVTSRGGPHISIPTSISNSGARPATILNAKLIESEPGRQSLWGALFATNVSTAMATINGAALNKQSSLFAPFLIPPGQEIQTVLVFTPVPEPAFADSLLARGGRTLRYTMVLNTTAGDITISKTVAWSGITDGALDKRAFGVANDTTDVDTWFDSTTPVPIATPQLESPASTSAP